MTTPHHILCLDIEASHPENPILIYRCQRCTVMKEFDSKRGEWVNEKEKDEDEGCCLK